MILHNIRVAVCMTLSSVEGICMCDMLCAVTFPAQSRAKMSYVSINLPSNEPAYTVCIAPHSYVYKQAAQWHDTILIMKKKSQIVTCTRNCAKALKTEDNAYISPSS